MVDALSQSLNLDRAPSVSPIPSDELGRQSGEDMMGIIASVSPLPSVSSTPPLLQTSSLTPLICDERAIHALLGSLLQKGGLSVSEAARRLGCGPSSLRQYLNGRRAKPSLLWFLRFCQMVGARVIIEFPASVRKTDL